MFQNIGFWDWVIIFGVVLVLFGGKRLPELAKSLGKSLSSFKKGIREGENELKQNLEDKNRSSLGPPDQP